ncbi:MAG: hypothetical protein AB7T37_10510 [Dehalococcoidia bacterium]
MQTRDIVEPLLERLADGLDAFAVAATASVCNEVRMARKDYVEALAALRPLVDEWLRIRGSGEQLWGATSFMTDEQHARFEAIGAREREEVAGRGHFDALSEKVKRELLLFEEFNP